MRRVRAENDALGTPPQPCVDEWDDGLGLGECIGRPHCRILWVEEYISLNIFRIENSFFICVDFRLAEDSVSAEISTRRTKGDDTGVDPLLGDQRYSSPWNID
jgi:hypothetical protein